MVDKNQHKDTKERDSFTASEILWNTLKEYSSSKHKKKENWKIKLN